MRDAIRLEHGLQPLDPKDVPRYSESPDFTFEDGQEAPRKRVREESVRIDYAEVLRLCLPGILLLALFIAWEVYPLAIFGLLLLDFCVRRR